MRRCGPAAFTPFASGASFASFASSEAGVAFVSALVSSAANAPWVAAAIASAVPIAAIVASFMGPPWRRPTGRVAPLFPNQADAGDFGGDAEAHRRSPVAGAAVDVDPHATEPVEARGEGLLQADEQVPWPELPAVRVTGELQVVAGSGRRTRGARLVREEHLHGVGRRAAHGTPRVAAVRGIEVMRRVVGDAGDGERGAAVLEQHVLVQQHVRAEAPKLAHPAVHAGVVLVVAGDEVGAMAGCEPCEGLGVPRELLDRAV